MLLNNASHDQISTFLSKFVILTAQNINRHKNRWVQQSCEFFVIDQITCSLTFLEEFDLLFHMQKESRQFQGKKSD